MISLGIADAVLLGSLAISLGCYLFVSRREGSYINIMTPAFVINIPAFYLLPLAYGHVFGVDGTPFAFVYVYLTLALENVIFAAFYTRRGWRPIRLPFSYGYGKFSLLAIASLTLAGLLFIPVLLEFREYVFDPRRIYEMTRTGFGTNFYLSSAAAYLAAIFVLFSNLSRIGKSLILLSSFIVLALHGSKGQVLDLLLFALLFAIYVKDLRLKLLPALAICLALAIVLIGLFAATITLGSPVEALQSVSSYSDYTRNAMLVIDSNFPPQYGRLTWESNVVALVPRELMPDKPKDYGAFYLDAEFYPSEMELDQGVPAFGIGVQYADFGVFAILYLAVFAALRGWLARIFVDRLKQTRHPADFVVVAFLAGVTLLPIGVGWPLPETLLVALCLRFASSIGADQVYRERLLPIAPASPATGLEGV